MSLIPSRIVMTAFLVVWGSYLLPSSMAGQPTHDLDRLVREDWAAQESRRGRTPGDPVAVREALSRVESLLGNFRKWAGGPTAVPDLHAEKVAFARLRRQVGCVELLDDPSRKRLYDDIRRLGRRIAMKNPLLAGRSLVFMKRRPFLCQMLHEYLGYYYDLSDLAGGGLYILKRPGHSLELQDLLQERLPRGAYATPAISPDGRTVYFAFAPVKKTERTSAAKQANWKQLPDARTVPEPLNYFGKARSNFQIYAVDVNGSNLRQLTDGPDDDFNPCPMPNGDIVFLSSRRGGFCRCNNAFEPLPTYTLHRMDTSGKNIKTLSYHETNEWHPSLLNDGRIIYSRWDYVDRSAANYHGLWVCGPDGTNPKILFGNYTRRINACYQPRAIPGSNRVAFLAGAHHAPVGGSLLLLDPSRVNLDPKTGEDTYESIEVLTPDVEFPEAPGWPDTFLHSPWPLSEDYFLVAFGNEPLGGYSPGDVDERETGIYYFDRFGNLELLYRAPGVACVGPIPLTPMKQATPASVLDSSLVAEDEGEFIVADVRWSLMPLPEDRPIRSMRIYQVLPKTTYIANVPRVGHANAESARAFLGTVPVEADGSAYFRAPARKPLYFQLVDASGHAVQSMRSVTYLQPGEQRACVGCHEEPTSAPPARRLLAMARGPSRIEPGPDGTRPFSYPRLVQPVLDRHCIACHDGTPGEDKGDLVLTGDQVGCFTRSYEELKPFVCWYEWGGKSITPMVTHPGRGGADESPLLGILNDATHNDVVNLSREDRRRLCIWLDSNVPFYGTYLAEEQRAQQAGQAVEMPKVQ